MLRYRYSFSFLSNENPYYSYTCKINLSHNRT